MSGLEEDNPESGTDALQVPLKADNESLSGMKHSTIHRTSFMIDHQPYDVFPQNHK